MTALAVLDLRTGYLREPVGIAAAHPRLSWRIEGGGRNLAQPSYRIRATRAGGKRLRFAVGSGRCRFMR